MDVELVVLDESLLAFRKVGDVEKDFYSVSYVIISCLKGWTSPTPHDGASIPIGPSSNIRLATMEDFEGESGFRFHNPGRYIKQ